MEIYGTGMINLKSNREVKQTPISNLRALNGKRQGFHIISNILTYAFSGQHY